jgi:hypothetical protein
MTRPDVVAAIISGIGDMDCTGFGRMLDQATSEEVHAATVRLRNAALRPTPDVLEFTLPQLATLAMQGRCLEWVGEQLGPIWRSWPDRSLADMLKTAEPWLVAQVRDALHRSGLAVDMGPMREADDDGLSNDAESAP